ncbi:MAG TPA: GTP-binding protein [Stellaceae bacterium]|nr:GTP-binding protein [Stellaceae bacterium]
MPFDPQPDGGVLRFITAGSVDDGKSTLIGRLLHDAGAVPKDQLAALRRIAARQGESEIDLSLLTDGLIDEREQGITIDVAYRYFATARRQFIVADTPGHEQYTRNMVTGASTADAAVILVDVRKGMTAQTRRHLYLSHLLGVAHLVVAVNKMDLVGFAQSAYEAVASPIAAFAAALGANSLHLVPLSAKHGDNVVRQSERMPWHAGLPLLALLEALPSAARIREGALRFPVQLVRRVASAEGDQRRLVLGRVESGRLSVGDEVMVMPAGTPTRIRSIVTYDGVLAGAAAPQAVTIELADPVDIRRGDLLVHAESPPRVARKFAATICWLADEPHQSSSQRRYQLKTGTQMVPARLEHIVERIDVATLSTVPAPETIARNDIARAQIALASPIAFDAYRENRATGGFILIDAQTQATVAAGMIELDAR